MKEPTPISAHYPPFIADALVAAAARHDVPAIDRITDEAVRQYPEMVVPRHSVRPEFLPVDRTVRLLEGRV
jgi:hypothetical protein